MAVRKEREQDLSDAHFSTKSSIYYFVYWVNFYYWLIGTLNDLEIPTGTKSFVEAFYYYYWEIYFPTEDEGSWEMVMKDFCVISAISSSPSTSSALSSFYADKAEECVLPF